ncbi:MAG: BTAD domain-containing putative transcriptional regulator, partial [Phycicoccus sp.]
MKQIGSSTSPAARTTGRVPAFRLLGHLALETGGPEVDLGHPKQQLVLAALLADAGRLVTYEQLTERVWGDEAPDRARASLHSHVARLRGILGGPEVRSTGRETELASRPGGYLLQVSADDVDVHRFRRLVVEARLVAADPARRAALLRDALGLWRGPALGALGGRWAERTRRTWEQEHLEAVLAWASAELAVGNPEVVLAPLDVAALRHPLTEPVVELSMRALWATGRTADAVQRYHRLRALLRRELGTDPAPPVAELFASIVRDHPAPARGGDPGASVRPAQLPIDLSGFSGRDAELGRLDGLLDDGGPSRVAPLIGVVTGPAGVGKTALAVRWAHRVSHRFPDGQLYGDLRGVDPDGPVDAFEVVRGFLAALGVPARQIPAAPQAQVGLYRSVVAGRRVLVVLDDAASADQVRPLLPNSPDAGVVVTSRRRLTPLVVAEGARPLQLDLLG